MESRIKYIDDMKGLCIFLVVLGHCISGENYLKNIIYSFHMPAFMLASGILLNYSSAKKKFSRFLVSRIKQLIVPYILFELLGYIVQCLTNGYYENLNGFIFRTITFQVHTDVDWFLIGLFFGEILFYFIHKNKYISIITATVAFVAAYFVPFLFLKWILSAFVYVIIGYYGISFFEKSRKEVILAAGIGVLVSAYFNERVDINNGVFGNPLFYLLGATGGTYLIISLCQKQIPFKYVWNFLGKKTLIVMGTHTLIIQSLWHEVFIDEIPDWLSSCWMLLIVLSCECIIIMIFQTVKKLRGVF